jgi:hypothetical protein
LVRPEPDLGELARALLAIAEQQIADEKAKSAGDPMDDASEHRAA